MKVLKRGRTLVCETTCPQSQCGATLEVEEGDLFTTHNPELYGHSRHLTYRCPCCGSVNQLPEDALVRTARGEILRSLYDPRS